MKKTFVAALLGIFALVLSSGAFAEEKATPQEVVAKVKEAAKLISEKGEAAYPLIRDPKGSFVWKDNYIFAQNLDGTMIVHINPKLEGKNMLGVKDADGKLFSNEMINGVKASPDGFWIEYKWAKPGEKDASKKVAFCVLAPKTEIFVGAGVWDMGLDDIKKAGL
ncbi:MAG: cache domain-containing protein [Desulfobacteraceae bacterium]|nr:cache domain-containing protein [Desulfobacteraceae bacterium]